MTLRETYARDICQNPGVPLEDCPRRDEHYALVDERLAGLTRLTDDWNTTADRIGERAIFGDPGECRRMPNEPGLCATHSSRFTQCDAARDRPGLDVAGIGTIADTMHAAQQREGADPNADNPDGWNVMGFEPKGQQREGAG